MKIVIPGGTGQVGTVLSRAFHRDGHDVVVLSRNPGKAPWRTVCWDAKTLGDWTAELEGAEAVINLAGRSVNCRYTQSNRRLIKESRVNSARIVSEAIAQAKSPPRAWLQMSTATIYAHRFDAPNDEAGGIIGGAEPHAPDTWRFSIDVATSWERVVDEAALPQTRKVKMRSAIVMNPDSGSPFELLLKLVRYGLGGKSGDGRQFMSWIHYEDLVRAVYWLIEHDELAGGVNLSAPHPLPNAEFMRTLREAWGVGFGLPANRLMLEVGAFFMRTETELILKSRRVTPKRLLESGFEFRFPTWREAATDLCRRWRELREASVSATESD